MSLFYGRIRDIGYDAASVVRQVRQTLRESGSGCEIIVGSIATSRHQRALQAGADIGRPAKFFRQMVSHPRRRGGVISSSPTSRSGWSSRGRESMMPEVESTTVRPAAESSGSGYRERCWGVCSGP